MKRNLIIIFAIVIILLLLLSIVYLWSNHEYDLADISEITTDKEYENIIYNKEEDIFNENILGVLEIEKIGLLASVKEGSSNEILKEYIGHISETAKYDGNIGLAAHNRLNKYSSKYMFQLIKNSLRSSDVSAKHFMSPTTSSVA